MTSTIVVDDLYPDTEKSRTDNIKGKTLEVYYFLAKNRSERYGVRQIQRELGYSSPSVASYHLSRLVSQGLIQKTSSGLYYIEGEPVKLGRLEDHILVAGKYIPRIVFYLYHGLLSILVAVAFFLLDVRTIYWFVYVVLSNVVFVVILLRDGRRILERIEVGENPGD